MNRRWLACDRILGGMGKHFKSDRPILGDSNFVEKVLGGKEIGYLRGEK